MSWKTCLIRCSTYNGYVEKYFIYMNEQQIIDGLKPICLCKGIRKSVFLRHIQDGCKTIEELRKATGAGSGPCKGKRCTPRILDLLQSK